MTTYTERTESAASALEQALRTQFKAANNVPILFQYGDRAYNIRDREVRIYIVAAILDEYYRDHGNFNQRKLDEWYEEFGKSKKPTERPSPVSVNTALIDRLTDVVLYDELVDGAKNKVSVTDYPFLSERQFDRRRENEYAESLAENYDISGNNRAKPERRVRIAREQRFVEKLARNKNRARNAQYKRDTTAGPVVRKETEPFTQCRGIAAKWRTFNDRCEHVIFKDRTLSVGVTRLEAVA